MKKAALVALAVVAGGVAVGVRLAGDADRTPPPSAVTSESRSPAPAASPSAEPQPPEQVHPVSLPALMRAEFDGRALRVRRVIARTSAYTSYAVAYRSDDLTISGLMNVPRGDGPFPALVLAHGYIDPDVYTTGRGFERSQAYLAQRGFVVLHTDYRNHASSDDEPDYEHRLRLGYTEDVINAVLALRRARLPYVDPDRIGLLGRSMGGGVALNVAVVRPDLVDAIVVFAPVSSDAVDNFDRWIRRRGERRRLAAEIAAAYGSPEENPAFWRGVSARTYFERVSVPILIHHGTADESVPVAWSHETLAELRRHDKDARLLTYEGERHAFGPAYFRAMERTAAFFRRHLR